MGGRVVVVVVGATVVVGGTVVVVDAMVVVVVGASVVVVGGSVVVETGGAFKGGRYASRFGLPAGTDFSTSRVATATTASCT